MPDSTSNGQNDIGLESPALSVPATTHPFFMPLSVRRAQAAATIAVDTAGSGNAQQPRKKLKQKPVSTATAATGTKSDTEKRARKTKAAATTALAAATNGSTKIHSFFAVNSKKPAAAAQQPDSLSVECVEDVIASAISVAVDAPVAAAVAMDVDPLLYASEFNAWPSQKPKRPMFRPKGVPAPYPSDPSHVPLPSYSAFEPATRDGCSRFSVDAIDIAAIQDSLSNLACSNRHPSDSTDSGCGQWKHAIGSHMAATQQPLHGSHRGRPSYASIRAAPAQVLSGNISLPPIPPHLQFAAPFLNMLADPEAAVQSRINCSSQLLASRHRPKKASEVLDNKRAVLQLHSWIEGMRLKRPPPATISAQQLSVFKKPAAAAKPPKSSKSTAKPQKCRRRAAESEASDDNHDFFYSSDGGNSSDDFVPRTASSSRRRKAKNEFDDIFAWAQSDGTVSSVREHKRNNLKRHRRRVSYGSSSDTETFSNVLLLEGPSGSGKTAAVYACAEESGFSVCEIHPGQRRSGKDVLAALEDVILSHTISVPAGAPDVTAATAVNQVLILIEQVDVLFEQDLRLWPALKQLALKSRRPIVLTCTDSTCVRWESFSFHSVLRFSRPSENLLVPYCFFLCLVEGTLVSLADLGTVCREAGCDLNRMLCALEVVTRQAATQKSELSGSTDDACDPAISPPPLVSSVSIDLGGTMAWLFNPLEPGETPETRHRFWVDLITSVQPADDTSNWFRLWPDPPPSFETPSTQAVAALGKTPIALAHQNTFFARSAKEAVLKAAKSTTARNGPSDSPITTNHSFSTAAPSLNVAISQPPVVLGIGTDVYTGSGSVCSVAMQSDLDCIDSMASALETLSVGRMTTSETPLQHECIREPLPSQLSPMADSCLDVNYMVLDFDVLSRPNPTLLPDGADSAIQYTGSSIDQYMRNGATEILHAAVAGCKISGEFTEIDINRMMRIRETKLPEVPDIEEAENMVTQAMLLKALDSVGIQGRTRKQSSVVEMVGYLSEMVACDWVHQGKLEPTAISLQPNTTNIDGGEATMALDGHAYRTGSRRTRTVTYRPHIKDLSVDSQCQLISWKQLSTKH